MSNSIIVSLIAPMFLFGVNCYGNNTGCLHTATYQNYEHQRLDNVFSGVIYYYHDTIALTFNNRTDSINYYTLGFWLKDDMSEVEREKIKTARLKYITIKKIVTIKRLSISNKRKIASTTNNFLFIDVDSCLFACIAKGDSIFLTKKISIDPTKTDWQVNFLTDSIYYSNAQGIWSVCYNDSIPTPICVYKMADVERFYLNFSGKHLRWCIKTFDNKIVFYPERKVINSQKFLKIVVICLIGFFCIGILVFIIWRLSFINFFKQIPKIIKIFFKPIIKEKNCKKRFKLIEFKSKKL